MSLQKPAPRRTQLIDTSSCRSRADASEVRKKNYWPWVFALAAGIGLFAWSNVTNTRHNVNKQALSVLAQGVNDNVSGCKLVENGLIRCKTALNSNAEPSLQDYLRQNISVCSDLVVNIDSVQEEVEVSLGVCAH